jgi:hypothetical protein
MLQLLWLGISPSLLVGHFHPCPESHDMSVRRISIQGNVFIHVRAESGMFTTPHPMPFSSTTCFNALFFFTSTIEKAYGTEARLVHLKLY